MKKVLYISNIEVPYRVQFFNELAKSCDLTVLYERESSANRNPQWAKGEKKNYRVKYLKGIRIGNESGFSLGILKEVFSHYDCVIVGCYNSPVQMLAMLAMRLFRIHYYLNLDGEPFLDGKGVKAKLKRFFLSGAEKYLVAGEKAGESIRPFVGEKKIIPYYFSSLSQQEICDHSAVAAQCQRSDTILVVGQYFDYKGLDVALEAAKRDPSRPYKFVGMGGRTELFRENCHTDEVKNVELIPFLQKEDLEREYQTCAMLVLPSRQECWGLVINEAASFGTPIVSTWGSGAAVEFLADTYPQYLAQPGDAEDLLRCIQKFVLSEHKDIYRDYLLEKSKEYHIEGSVQSHLCVI